MELFEGAYGSSTLEATRGEGVMPVRYGRETNLKALSTTLIGATVLCALAGCGKKQPVIYSVDPTFVTSVHSDLNTIGTAIVLYAQDHSHVLPQFDSATMPSWWNRYGGGRTLTPGVSYTIAPGLPGTKIDKLTPSSDFVIAKSKDLTQAGGQSNTIVMSFDNTFVYR